MFALAPTPGPAPLSLFPKSLRAWQAEWKARQGQLEAPRPTAGNPRRRNRVVGR
jgi:hypothetical protein